MPYESHGDPRNITVNDVKEAVSTLAAHGIDTTQAIKNIDKTWPTAKEADKRFTHTKDVMATMKNVDYSGAIGKAIKGKK